MYPNQTRPVESVHRITAVNSIRGACVLSPHAIVPAVNAVLLNRDPKIAGATARDRLDVPVTSCQIFIAKLEVLNPALGPSRKCAFPAEPNRPFEFPPAAGQRR